MKMQLKTLENRRKELEKELKLLTEKEEILLGKTRALEGKLEIREKVEKPEQFEKTHEKLKASEDIFQKKYWSRNFDSRAQRTMPIQQKNQLAGTGETSKSRNGARYNRVKLERNIILSWSYKKLP